MSPPFSWVSVSPNLNLLKLELGVDYLFKTKKIVKETANTKDTGLPCSDVLRLFSAGKGQRSVGRDPSPTRSVPMYL